MELPHLLVITDRSQAKRPLAQVLEEVFAAGCRLASVREKDLSAEERKKLVEELLPIARRFGARLLVHGDLEAAKLCDGVHLPAGGDVRAARGLLGERALIALSCHTIEEIERAEELGVDYVTIGPVGPTKSKPGYEPSFSLSQLEKRKGSGIKIFALGGVDETNLASLRGLGIWGIAGMGGFMRDEAPGALFARWALTWEWLA